MTQTPDPTAMPGPPPGVGDLWPEPDLLRSRSVVFFFPRADTPGCTAEAINFSEALDRFAAAGVSLLGVSRDTSGRLARFAQKHGLRVPLHSDAEGTLSNALGIWVEKTLYGKRHMGLERTTYLVGADGYIEMVWRRVRVPGHVEQVLGQLQAGGAGREPA